MRKSRNRSALDQNATCLAILLGMILGALYAITHIGKSGAVRRKDVAQIGGGSLELEIEASLRDAKAKAKQRLDDGSQVASI